MFLHFSPVFESPSKAWKLAVCFVLLDLHTPPSMSLTHRRLHIDNERFWQHRILRILCEHPLRVLWKLFNLSNYLVEIGDVICVRIAQVVVMVVVIVLVGSCRRKVLIACFSSNIWWNISLFTQFCISVSHIWSMQTVVVQSPGQSLFLQNQEGATSWWYRVCSWKSEFNLWIIYPLLHSCIIIFCI